MENKFKAKWESLENPDTQPRAMRETVVLEFEEFKKIGSRNRSRGKNQKTIS